MESRESDMTKQLNDNKIFQKKNGQHRSSLDSAYFEIIFKDNSIVNLPSRTFTMV